MRLQISPMTNNLSNTAIGLQTIVQHRLCIHKHGVSPPIEEGSFQSGTNLGWLGAYQVNLIAPWKIVSTFLEHSKLSNYAKLMFITSISGSLREAAYACSKAALNKMVGDLAQYQPQNVDFCLIDPGWFY